jgi:hypothetical protein
LRVTLQDGTNAEKEIRQNFFYAGGWESLADSLNAAAPDNPVRQAQIEVIISGKLRLILDDLYCRRAEEEFAHSAPEIISINVSPSVVLVGEIMKGTQKITIVEPVSLEADIFTPESGAITSRWSSDKAGDLGEGLKRQVRLTQEGKHNLTFMASDEYGFSAEEYTEVEVVRPKPILLREKLKEQGKLFLRLGLGELEKWANELEIKAYLYANKKPIACAKGYPCKFKVDTRRLPQGKVEFQAKAFIEAIGAGKEGGIKTPYISNAFILKIRNHKGAVK